MHAHAGSESVSVEALKALAELAYRCDDNKQLEGAAGALEAILDVMAGSMESQRLQTEALRAIFTLAIRRDLRARAMEHGALTVILDCLRTHNATSATVFEHCCRVLAEFVHEDPAARDAVIVGGGIAALLCGYVEHVEERKVRERCTALLQDFGMVDAVLPECVRMLRGCESSTAALLHAIRAFEVVHAALEGASASCLANCRATLIQAAREKRTVAKEAWTKDVAQAFGRALKKFPSASAPSP